MNKLYLFMCFGNYSGFYSNKDIYINEKFKGSSV